MYRTASIWDKEKFSSRVNASNSRPTLQNTVLVYEALFLIHTQVLESIFRRFPVRQ